MFLDRASLLLLLRSPPTPTWCTKNIVDSLSLLWSAHPPLWTRRPTIWLLSHHFANASSATGSQWKAKTKKPNQIWHPDVAGKAATGWPRPWCHCLKLLPNRISGKKRPRLPWKTLPQMIPWANRPLASDMSPRLACTNKYLRKYKIPLQHTICHNK